MSSEVHQNEFFAGAWDQQPPARPEVIVQPEQLPVLRFAGSSEEAEYRVNRLTPNGEVNPRFKTPNEDSYGTWPELGLAAVADGAGGGGGNPAAASESVIKTLESFFSCESVKDATEGEISMELVKSLMESLKQELNTNVRHRGQGGSTTLTFAKLLNIADKGPSLVIGSIGDSGALQFPAPDRSQDADHLQLLRRHVSPRDGVLRKPDLHHRVTDDPSFGIDNNGHKTLYGSAMSASDTFSAHPDYLATSGDGFKLTVIPAEPGTSIVLATDGVLGDTQKQLLTAAELVKIEQAPNAQAKFDTIMQLTGKRNNPDKKDDDRTAIVIDILEPTTVAPIADQPSYADERPATAVEKRQQKQQIMLEKDLADERNNYAALMLTAPESQRQRLERKLNAHIALVAEKQAAGLSGDDYDASVQRFTAVQAALLQERTRNLQVVAESDGTKQLNRKGNVVLTPEARRAKLKAVLGAGALAVAGTTAATIGKTKPVRQRLLTKATNRFAKFTAATSAASGRAVQFAHDRRQGSRQPEQDWSKKKQVAAWVGSVAIIAGSGFELLMRLQGVEVGLTQFMSHVTGIAPGSHGGGSLAGHPILPQGGGSGVKHNAGPIGGGVLHRNHHPQHYLPRHATLGYSGDSIWNEDKQRLGGHASLANIDRLTNRTLRINGLSQTEARHLPVGYKFKLPRHLLERLNSGK